MYRHSHFTPGVHTLHDSLTEYIAPWHLTSVLHEAAVQAVQCPSQKVGPLIQL